MKRSVKWWLAAGLAAFIGSSGSGNRLAAASLQLRAKGNQLLTTQGNKPVILKGVNVPGLEWSSGGEGPKGPLGTVEYALTQWKANFIRLPLSQDRWFGQEPGQKDKGAAYQRLVDTIVSLVNAKGGWVALDLHWSNAGVWGKNIGQHKMPDDNSTVFWTAVAKKYANHPAVIFDLYNEPHNVSWWIWKKGGEVKETEGDSAVKFTGSYHTPGMQALLDTARDAGANNLVLVGGLDFAYDLTGPNSGYALKDKASGFGIIYATHIYAHKAVPWDNFVVDLGKYPIIVSEAGAGPADGEGWMKTCLAWINLHKFSYSAWSMHPGAAPCAIKDWSYAPTPWEGTPLMEDLLGIAAKGSAADCGKTGGLAWGFENINESGFTLNTGSGNEAGTSIKASTAQAHCGSASLSIPFAATAGNHIIDPFLQNGIKPAADLTGKTVSCWVFLKADPPPAGAPAAQMCAVTKDGRYICDGYRGGLPLNQWFDLAVTYGANHKAQDITSLDIQILSPTKGNSGQTWNGTAYFDDIRISDKVASPASPR